MFARLRHVLNQLDLEEKILHAGALVGMIGVACPWIGGEWLGGTSVMHTGFGFYTSFLGLGVFVLNGFILFTTCSPLLGGPEIVRREQRTIAQLLVAAQAVVLSIAALSVLMRVAFEFSRVEIRFGIYTSMIGSLTASLYAFLKWQEERRQKAESCFHHDEPLVAPLKNVQSVPTLRKLPRDPIVERPRVAPEVRTAYVLPKDERREMVEQIKENVVTTIEPPGSPPPPPPKIIPKAPAIEEHPIFRGL